MEDDIKHLDNIVEESAKKFLENHKDDINMVIMRMYITRTRIG